MSAGLRIALVGSGPAALYAAAELAQQREPVASVNMIDRLPCIGGLVRAGVAPDHADRRLMIDAYEKLARGSGRCEFFGNVTLGRDVTHEELLAHHHAVIYATGASGSQRLDIAGAGLPGCYAANEFVGWYNGHPDHSDLAVDLACERAVVIGNGNVALDIARMLLKSEAALGPTDTADPARHALATSRITEVVVIGRRGPLQASFTHPELHELGTIPDLAVQVDPRDLDAIAWPQDNFALTLRRKCLEHYATTATARASKRLWLRFLTTPVAIHGESRVAGLTTMRNRLEAGADGQLRAVATGQTGALKTGLIVHALGYRAAPPPGLVFDEHSGTVPNDRGRVSGAVGTYVTGWIKRGPRGVIGSNKVCAAETVGSVMLDAAAGQLRSPRGSHRQFIDLLRERQPHTVDYRGWKLIDRHERSHAESGAPRRKLYSLEDLLRVANAAASAA